MANSSNNSIRHVAVFSSGRHDWGYLSPVVSELAGRSDFRVSVYRVFSEFTASELGEIPDGVNVEHFAIVDSSCEICPSLIADVSTGFSEVITRDRPDIFLVLGDRTETLAAVVVAVSAQIIIAHIHGGDKAPGELDDANRHAITKLAHIHFAATDDAAERISRLGEQQWRICMSGSPGIDSILASGLPTSAEAAVFAGVSEPKAFVLLVLHPEGLGEDAEAKKCEKICQAVVNTSLQCVCVCPNPDYGSGAITMVLDKFSKANNWPIFQTLPRGIFLRLMADSVALLGNSSSAMIESAAVGAAAIDVGSRQSGRVHSANVVHAEADTAEIELLVRRMLEDEDFASRLRSATCVYGDGKASERIAEKLAALPLDKKTRIKLIEY